MKVCTFLTEKFETVEALAVVDILRRAKIEVDMVSISDSLQVKSAQNITVEADYILANYDLSGVDALFFPGGGGHVNYRKCEKLASLVKEFNDSGKCIAAICAAPSFFGELGILKGRKATCFPGFEDALEGAILMPATERVVTDGNIVTSRGMGTSVDLGLELVKIFCGKDKADQLGKTIQYM